MAQRPTAADAFAAYYKLEELRRVRDAIFGGIDALLLPTAPTVYTVQQVLADPIQLNSRLGTYTNFVNLLDLCGLAVPAAMRGDGVPSGVTLLAPGGHDAFLASIGRVFHADTALPLGASKLAQPPLTPLSAAPAPDEIALAVVGAHLSGLPLNHELRNLGARLLQATSTAPDYKLFALPGGEPRRPGLLRVAAGQGSAIEVGDLGDERRGVRPLRRERAGAAVDRHAEACRWQRGQGLSGRSRGDRRRAGHFELRRLARLYGESLDLSVL